MIVVVVVVVKCKTNWLKNRANVGNVRLLLYLCWSRRRRCRWCRFRCCTRWNTPTRTMYVAVCPTTLLRSPAPCAAVSPGEALELLSATAVLFPTVLLGSRISPALLHRPLTDWLTAAAAAAAAGTAPFLSGSSLSLSRLSGVMHRWLLPPPALDHVVWTSGNDFGICLLLSGTILVVVAAAMVVAVVWLSIFSTKRLPCALSSLCVFQGALKARLVLSLFLVKLSLAHSRSNKEWVFF